VKTDCQVHNCGLRIACDAGTTGITGVYQADRADCQAGTMKYLTKTKAGEPASDL